MSIGIAVQIYIATSRELPVPDFILRGIESRLAASGVAAKFGHTSFDPSGRILVENTRLTIASFSEPIATAQLLYIELDPWSLLAGHFKPTLIRASDVRMQIPAMLSDSGRSESILHDIDLTLAPIEHGLEFSQVSAKLGNLSLNIHGAIDLRELPKSQADSLPLLEFAVTHYSEICRRLTMLSRQLESLDSPNAEIALRPSEKLGAIAHVSLQARGFRGGERIPVMSGPLLVSTQIPLWGHAPVVARIHAQTDSLSLHGQTHATGVRATLRVRATRDDEGISLRQAEIEARSVESNGAVATDLSLRLNRRKLPHAEVELDLHLGAEPIHLQGSVNTNARSALLNVAGRFDPRLMLPLGQILGRDLRPFINFGTAPEFDLQVAIAPGGRWGNLSGRVRGRDVYAYRVTLDEIEGDVSFDGRSFVATNARAQIGTNLARGSYTHDVATQDFRFLLKGRLRPADIGGWFREWWPNFWSNFEFPTAAPDAEVDVQGRWRDGPATQVFVFADCLKPVIKGVALDRAVTRIYLRPHYYHAIEVAVTSGTGAARGTFTRRNEDHQPTLRRMDFEFDSNLKLEEANGLIGPDLDKVFSPYVFQTPPKIKTKGYLLGPEATGRPQRHVKIEGRSNDPFTLHGFPLDSLSFRAELNDDNLLVEPLIFGFALGTGRGKLRVHGAPGKQRMGFDLSLKRANLRQAAVILDEFSAHKQGKPAPTTNDYVERTANVSIDLNVSAEGDLDNPYSYEGTGNAELSGQGLGEIRLLGLLSELINFTALSFNNLRANFSVDRDKLHFSEVSVTGANAAVAGHGNYSLDQRTLDFNARIYPFQESKFILKSVIGAVLTPLSNVLEVKLSGDLNKPSWAFVIGPTNFLRNLVTPGTPVPRPAPPPPAPHAANEPSNTPAPSDPSTKE